VKWPSKYWWQGFWDGLSFGPLWRGVQKSDQLKGDKVMDSNAVAKMQSEIDSLKEECRKLSVKVDELELYSSISYLRNPEAERLMDMTFERTRIYNVVVAILKHLNMRLVYKPGTEAQTVLESDKKQKARSL